MVACSSQPEPASPTPQFATGFLNEGCEHIAKMKLGDAAAVADFAEWNSDYSPELFRMLVNDPNTTRSNWSAIANKFHIGTLQTGEIPTTESGENLEIWRTIKTSAIEYLDLLCTDDYPLDEEIAGCVDWFEATVQRYSPRAMEKLEGLIDGHHVRPDLAKILLITIHSKRLMDLIGDLDSTELDRMSVDYDLRIGAGVFYTAGLTISREMCWDQRRGFVQE